MKRIIALVLAALVSLSLCSCKKDNSIKLTLENYKDYINVDPNIANDGSSSEVKLYMSPYGSLGYFYENIRFNLRVEGVSPNYVYNDVVITGTFEGNYSGVHYFGVFDEEDILVEEPFSFDLTVDTNIAGGGENNYIFTPTYPFLTERGYFMVSFNVTDISGSVTPIK